MKLKYLIALFVLPFVACIKEDTNEIEGKGPQLLRIPEASEEINIVGFDATPGITKLVMMYIQRDANSQSNLNGATEVKLTLDNSLIDAYNTEHGSSLIPMETGTYSLESLNLTFNPGEFAKPIYISLDPSKLDLEKKFGLGIKIDNASGGFTPVPSLSKALFNIVIKNEWDARYKSTGIFHHPTAGDRDIDELKDFITVGPNSIEGNLGDLGGAGYRMRLTINADNSVTIEPRGVTPNINQTHGPNFYDPATKSFTLNYSYNVTAPRIIEETLARQ